MSQAIQTVDCEIVLWVHNHLSCTFFDYIMPLISFLGNNGFLWIALGIVMIVWGFWKKSSLWRWGIFLLLCLGITALIANLWIKPQVARIRPFQYLNLPLLIPPPTDFSFPSGHTAAACAAAIAFWKMNQKLGIVMFVFAGIMAFSRLYLMVHYPTDLLAGAGIGCLVSSLLYKLLKKKLFEKADF